MNVILLNDPRVATNIATKQHNRALGEGSLVSSAQVVNVITNSHSQDHAHPDDHTLPCYKVDIIQAPLSRCGWTTRENSAGKLQL